MDVSTLHTLTEDLAAFLSEVTLGDLRLPVPSISGDLGDLYIHLVDRNERLVTTLTGEVIADVKRSAPRRRADLEAGTESYGDCGLEAGYRRSALLVENAFTSAHQRERDQGRPSDVELATTYETQIGNTVLHTWDIARALGFAYQPTPDIARQVLRSTLRLSTQTAVKSQPDADLGVTVDGTGVFDCVLRLSGRTDDARDNDP
ncbi:maleylpyruvate isomerase N-terminal domain-containing protein [Agromyces sp. NPDC049794]|uniref:maleylpyruvate isomerase N-terminal domain-containing protein n=1 Tax=unclassified Agromyces TaxID=2639701 RepID=UPI0033F1CC36